jgi:hypothetical protein
VGVEIRGTRRPFTGTEVSLGLVMVDISIARAIYDSKAYGYEH